MILEETIKEYEQNGAVRIPQAVSGKNAAQLMGHLDHLIAGDQDRWTTNRLGGFSDRHLWPIFPWMCEFCTKSKLPEIAAVLMRSKTARLFFDHTFVRDPGADHQTPWHQDRTYWPFKGNQIASVWVALTECDAQSSGLRFIKGSHSWGKIFKPEAFGKTSASAQFLDGNTAYDEMPDFDSDTETYPVLDWQMYPGDAIVFGAEVVHGSAPNSDPNNRRGAISIRYVGDDARWDPRPGTDPIVTQDKVSINPGDRPLDDRWFPEVWNSQL